MSEYMQFARMLLDMDYGLNDRQDISRDFGLDEESVEILISCMGEALWQCRQG